MLYVLNTALSWYEAREILLRLRPGCKDQALHPQTRLTAGSPYELCGRAESVGRLAVDRIGTEDGK